jgi:hypothetical protein
LDTQWKTVRLGSARSQGRERKKKVEEKKKKLEGRNKGRIMKLRT